MLTTYDESQGVLSSIPVSGVHANRIESLGSKLSMERKMTKLVTSAVVVILTAAVTAAMAQPAPSAESRQMASPNAADPAVRAAVMASTIQTAPVHPKGLARAMNGDPSLSALSTNTGPDDLALKLEPASR
jgi:hypothetical protein